ncbi:hypothetical protein [Citrobacter amalonaticus]|nr:hypothetical protein [Citrobacter amalonaticus]
MGKMTFVVEFEDGKEPVVSAALDVAGVGWFPFYLMIIAMTFFNQNRLTW